MSRKPKMAALADIPKGQGAVIAAVDQGLGELLDIGFVPGAQVKPTHSGLGGDPRVYELDGTLVALRTAAARHIYVTVPDAVLEGGD
jgi:Fe2+ transport system protein FeoA